MTSLKTKNIWFLAAFLFLSIVPTLAKVVATVQQCNKFVRQGTPPHIPNVLESGNILYQNRYKVICQTYEDKERFLTVYDINNKIPVFSAYEYRGRGPKRVRNTWKIEPQLEDNMMKEQVWCTNQAVNHDYHQNDQNNYDPGHLFPVSHTSTLEDQISTFTLTNAVPQHQRFNQGRWSQMEEGIRDTMDQHINNQVRCFVVVGAIPGNNNLNNRVNIPAWMWSAFYCTDQTSRAYWSNNDDVDTLHEGTLQDLRSTGIDPFPRAP